MAQQVTEPTTNDITLSNGLGLRYYEWAGNGPNLVLIHPSSGYGRMWDFVARRLNGEFRIYAVDTRGHGDSDRPDSSYSAEEIAEDMHLFIEQLGLAKAFVAGHSLGGRVAQALASAHPEQVRGIMLVGGPHYANFFPERHRIDSILEGVERMRASVSEFPSEEAALNHFRELRPSYSEEVLQNLIAYNMRHLPDGGLELKYDKVRVAQGLTHMTASLRAHAERITCPVALMIGAQSSHITRVEAEEVAKFWKTSQIFEMDGDYGIQVDNPDGLANAIQEFTKVATPA